MISKAGRGITRKKSFMRFLFRKLTKEIQEKYNIISNPEIVHLKGFTLGAILEQHRYITDMRITRKRKEKCVLHRISHL